MKDIDWYGTQTQRLARARKIASHFKKLKAGGTPAFGVSPPERSGNAYVVYLTFRAGGSTNDEFYKITVKGIGLGTIFVSGFHGGMVSEIQGIAGQIR